MAVVGYRQYLVVDTFSSLSSLNAQMGDMAFAQDKTLFYMYNGSLWIGNTPTSTPLFTSSTYKQVNANLTGQFSTDVSTVPASGVGSMTLPANYATVGKTIEVTLYGTYQTPLNPGSVLVKIKLGGTTLASVNVAASVLATSSTYKEIYGSAVITFYSTGSSGTVVCNGFMTFEIAAGTTTVPFSTAATVSSNTATVTVDTTQPLLVDVTANWSNQQAQGTYIQNALMRSFN